VLSASWPAVTRRRACAWHVCGAGLGGVLSARGGDAVRIALAKRDLRDATWPALAGTLAAEGSFETVCGLLVAVAAVQLGVSTLHLPSIELLAAAVVLVPLAVLTASRCARIRRLARESPAASPSSRTRAAGRARCSRSRSARGCSASARPRASCSRSASRSGRRS
jgi:hypothetical protein